MTPFQERIISQAVEALFTSPELLEGVEETLRKKGLIALRIIASETYDFSFNGCSSTWLLSIAQSIVSRHQAIIMLSWQSGASPCHFEGAVPMTRIFGTIDHPVYSVHTIWEEARIVASRLIRSAYE